MRPIKFRVWDKQSEQMFNVYSIEFRKNGLYVNLDTPSKANGLRESWLFGDRFELMQFTGLHDKNGKEIYEGDILNFDYPMEVIWAMGSWAVKAEKGDSLLYGYTNEGEVIGNIYENPELLK